MQYALLLPIIRQATDAGDEWQERKTPAILVIRLNALLPQTRALAFTNQTLLPEALEKWPVAWFEIVRPRQREISYEIIATADLLPHFQVFGSIGYTAENPGD